MEKTYLEAQALSFGLDGAVDQRRANELYEKAIAEGDPRALAWQARRIFSGGLGFQKNPSEAKVFFLKNEAALAMMAEKNIPDAKRSLALSWGVLFPKEKGADAFALLQGISSDATSSELDDLGWFYENGIGTEKNLVKAFECYKKSADRGNASAMGGLGLCFENGKGTAKDEKEAVRWYSKAAELGDGWALNQLGLCYYNGIGLVKDYSKAYQKFKMAAEKDNASGMGNLGLCYETGNGVVKDEKEAVRWYAKAAELGDGWALNKLGERYNYGIGVEKDYSKAYRFFKKAADQDDANGMGNLGLCYETGNGVTKNEREAVRWYSKAADLGNGWALNQLGLCYEQGRGVEKDPKKAFQCYLRSAEAGNASGQNLLGACYYGSVGVEQDFAMAFQWFKKSADQGNSTAMGNLGLCYEAGNGVAKDEKEAVRCYTKAAELGDGWALNKLGLCYANGRGVQKDFKKAFDYYLKSAKTGNAWGQYNTGTALLNGQGVRQDDQEAFRWLQRAADQENWSAVASVGYCLQTGRGTRENPALALEKYQMAAKNGNDLARKNIELLAESCFWKKDYSLSSKAFEISQALGNLGAAEGLYRNHVLMRKSWPGADPRKGLAARWVDLQRHPSKAKESLALAYEALDFGYPSLAQEICTQTLFWICPNPSEQPGLHSALHRVRGYALLAGEDCGAKVAKDGIPASWPDGLFPEFAVVGYFLGSVTAGEKSLGARIQFTTDFLSPGAPRWWGVLGGQIMRWGQEIQAGKESGWYRRLARTAKANEQSGVDLFWGTVPRKNLDLAEGDFRKAQGSDLYSALVGRVVVASQKNSPSTLKELSAQLSMKQDELQREKSGASRKGMGKAELLAHKLNQAKPGALPWGNELGELSFGMGFGSGAPGAQLFSRGLVEAAKGLLGPLLLKIKPEWVLLGCDFCLRNNYILPNEAVIFYEFLAEKQATRSQAVIRLVQLHLQNQEYEKAVKWAQIGLKENQDFRARAWLNACIEWVSKLGDLPGAGHPASPSAGPTRPVVKLVPCQNPRKRYLALHAAVQDADRLAVANNKGALSAYKKIQIDLLGFKKEFPEWEPTIVQILHQNVERTIHELEGKQ